MRTALAPLLVAAAALASPLETTQHVLSPAAAGPGTASSSAPRPLVIWHGLGDSAHSDGMDSFIEFVQRVHPGIFVHSIVVPEDGSVNDERNAGWWGLAEDHAQQGCAQIMALDELAGGFDAIGFSQGGLFLRFYAQFCKGPKMRNLLTFGSPHYGISALIPCPDPPTLSCRLAARAAKAGIYTAWAQSHLVQAQYYRDPGRLDEFLFANTFLRDLNSEGLPDYDGSPRGDGGAGLGHLENVVAFAFEEDTTLFPALSAHWATVSRENSSAVDELRDQQLYTDDWIGLKKLDKRGALHLEFCPGQHMDLGGEGGCGDKAVRKWLGWSE